MLSQFSPKLENNKKMSFLRISSVAKREININDSCVLYDIAYVDKILT